MPTQLDFGQVLKGSYDESNQALQVRQIASGLVTQPYDYIALTYVPSGNGAGQIQTVTYKSGGSSGTTVSVLTLTYNAQNTLDTVTKT